MLRVEVRKQFWDSLSKRAPHVIYELTGLEPALEAIKQWPEHEAQWITEAIERWPDDKGRWTYVRTCLIRAISSMRNHPSPLDIEWLRSSDEIGPLRDWPVGHIDKWCLDHGLDSYDLRADAFVTLTSNLYVDVVATSLGEPRFAGPVLRPEEIPSVITTSNVQAVIAEMQIGLRNDGINRGPRRLFSDEDLQQLADLRWEARALRSADTARLNGTVKAILKRALKRGTVRSAAVLENHVDWFVRHRIQGHRLKDIAYDYDVKITGVSQGIRRVAKLLGLPRPSSGRPPAAKLK